MSGHKPRSVVATPLWGVLSAWVPCPKRRTAPWLQRTGAHRSSITGLGSHIQSRLRVNGFTLAELLVSVSVLVLLTLLATQLLNNAATL